MSRRDGSTRSSYRSRKAKSTCIPTYTVYRLQFAKPKNFAIGNANGIGDRDSRVRLLYITVYYISRSSRAARGDGGARGDAGEFQRADSERLGLRDA